MRTAPPPLIQWMSRADAAQHAGISTTTLDRWIRAGRVPAHRIGRTVRISRSELDAALMASSGGGVR